MSKASRLPQYRTIPLIAAFALVCSSAAAQAPAPPLPNDPDATLVEELVVTARDKGPAWWTVSDGDTTVYVLGSPSLAPKRMQWDRAVFDRRLAGASVVIVPYQDVKVKFKGALSAAFNMARLQGGPFENSVGEPLKGRFVAARERLKTPAKRYGTHHPLAAALMLADDYRDATQLTTTDPTKLIKYLAQLAKVPVVQKSYDLGAVSGALIKTPKAASLACLGEVIDQVQSGPGVTLAAAKAWADGDVRGALDNERSYERCMAVVPGALAFDARVKADQVAAIEKALTVPGHAIAVVQLRPLLAQGGVLDQLRAKGYAVKTPGED